MISNSNPEPDRIPNTVIAVISTITSRSHEPRLDYLARLANRLLRRRARNLASSTIIRPRPLNAFVVASPEIGCSTN
jgi:anaerobic C4-dicarboxylate transporter